VRRELQDVSVSMRFAAGVNCNSAATCELHLLGGGHHSGGLGLLLSNCGDGGGEGKTGKREGRAGRKDEEGAAGCKRLSSVCP
jgi:hypothetical protein